MNEILKNKIELLPSKPGSYQMRDCDGKIIYVGKAKDLKKRVSQYFYRRQVGKTFVMVSKVCDFSIIVTNTEKEALILERNLIEKYHPKYNIMLMDDKHYPYIMINKNLRDPYLSISRKIISKNSDYYGPFPNSSAAFNVLSILNKLFPLRKCKNIKKTPCLYYHLNQCVAPCINKISKEQYELILKDISDFLKGKNKKIFIEIKNKIKKYSEEMNYEMALEYKNLYLSIQNIIEKQNVDLNKNETIDFIAFYTKDSYVSITFIFVRYGRILSKKTFVYEIIGDLNEIICDVIFNYYSKNFIPKKIIVSTLDIKKSLEEIYNINCFTATKGKYFNLLQIAKENSIEELEVELSLKSKNNDKIEILEELAKILNISFPSHIELFDNSHLMGTNSIGAMVCYINGEPNKKMYRKYNIDYTNGDDLLSMEKVLYKRYSRLKEENLEFPDLIIVDGGKNQVNVAKKVLNELNLNINIAGLVKDDKHETKGLIDINDNYIDLSNSKELFFFLTRMQDEVHRFAISTHIKKRSNNMFNSIFDDIKGIGRLRKELIIKTFPTLDELKNAKLEEFQQILPKDISILLYNKIHGI